MDKRDERVFLHWVRCPECRYQLKNGEPQMTCETYLRLIGARLRAALETPCTP
jgi:hypothetical protein